MTNKPEIITFTIESTKALRERQLQFHQQFVAWFELGAAFDADLPHEPLRQHRFDSRGDEERGDSHVAQSSDRRRRPPYFLQSKAWGPL